MKRTGLILQLNIPVGLSAKGQISDLKGQVVDATTREFTTGAIVLLGEKQLQTQTNETGQYSFEEIEPGIYTLLIVYTGFEKMEISVEVKPGTSQTFVHSL